MVISRYLPSRPTVSLRAIAPLVTVYVLTIGNATFVEKSWHYLGQAHALAFVAFIAAIVALGWALLAILSFPFAFKLTAAVLILTASAAGYFVDAYGIVIDRDMMASVFATTTSEAGELITREFCQWFVVTGLLPVSLLFLVRCDHPPVGRAACCNAGIALACAAAALTLVLVNFPAIAGTVRNHRDLVKSLNPLAPIAGTVSLLFNRARHAGEVVAEIGLDAYIEAPAGARPRLLVIVVGEAARARSFAVNGYERDTTPELAGIDLINFTDASSCGTQTQVSLPCMFSVYRRDDYSYARGRNTENLMDVLDHAGLRTFWWDNNSGHKHVADRIGSQQIEVRGDSPYCGDDGCFDEEGVERIRRYVDGLSESAVLVLHQIGSHGPAYYRRIPESFRLFQPACASAELADCTRDEVINAYDNTIAYTDHVLARTIEVLRDASRRFDTAMIYVSDHGESTGELGLYLHGLPYMLAPSEQTHIPFMVWLSPALAATAGIDADCLRATASASVSHDNLFHSVLGLMDVRTAVYGGDLDLFARCKRSSIRTSGLD